MENPTSLFVGPVRVLYADAEEEGKQAAEKELSGDDLLLFKVSSEYQARQILEKERMDILICDNSLPSEGGASLLKWVRERHRGIGRIIVGRERDRSSLMQALTKGVAVLSLSNPWEPGTLKERILHFGRLKRTLNNPRLFRLINTLDRLPTLPRIYNDFMDALERDKAAADLAKILNRDPAIASKILQIANSAFFRSTKSLSLERAVVYLGSNTLREIVLSVSFAENSQITPEQDRWIDELSFHAIQVNTFTHSFYQHLYGTPLPDSFSSVGLLHDIGKNLLFSLFPRRFKSLWEKSHKEGLPFRSAETEEEVFHDEMEPTSSILNLPPGGRERPLPPLPTGVLHPAEERSHGDGGSEQDLRDHSPQRGSRTGDTLRGLRQGVRSGGGGASPGYGPGDRDKDGAAVRGKREPPRTLKLV